MWRIWSDTIEELLLKKDEKQGNHKRSDGAKAIQEQCIATAAPNLQSAMEVKIRRTIRRAKEMEKSKFQESDQKDCLDIS